MLTKLKEIAARIAASMFFVEDGLNDAERGPINIDNALDLIASLYTLAEYSAEGTNGDFDWNEQLDVTMCDSCYAIGNDFHDMDSDMFIAAVLDLYQDILNGLREAVALERQNQIQKTLPNPEATQ
jgi:hypothetical protein